MQFTHVNLSGDRSLRDTGAGPHNPGRATTLPGQWGGGGGAQLYPMEKSEDPQNFSIHFSTG